MERTINNKVLLRALEPKERPSLPSNFAYTTMRRIRLERQKSEQRQRIVAVCCVLAVTILGIGGLFYMFGATITLFCLAFFALLNHWLARHYMGRNKT